MSVLSWFKFTIWNHWYKPNRINFKYESPRGSLRSPRVQSAAPLSGADQRSILIPFKPNYLSYHNARGGSAALLANGIHKPFIHNNSLSLVLFKTNMFLSLYGVSRAIYLGYVFINLKPSRSNLNIGIRNYNLITIYSSFKYSKFLRIGSTATPMSTERLHNWRTPVTHIIAPQRGYRGSIISGFLLWFNLGNTSLAASSASNDPRSTANGGAQSASRFSSRSVKAGTRSSAGLPTNLLTSPSMLGSIARKQSRLASRTGLADPRSTANGGAQSASRFRSRSILTNSQFISINPNIKSFFILPTSVGPAGS
jgi:hypothetical protein